MYSCILLQVHIALSLWLNKKLQDIRNWRTTSLICVFMWGSTWISILQVRGLSFFTFLKCDWVSYKMFWGSQREGPDVSHYLCKGVFFHEWGPKFFCVGQWGDQKKLVTRDHKQTAPLPVKYDSSLMNFNGNCLYYGFVYSYRFLGFLWAR